MASEINLRYNALPIFCPSPFCYRLVLYIKVYFQILLMAISYKFIIPNPLMKRLL